MALGSSLSGINFSGLSSGIDTASIVSRLMQLESFPMQRLELRKQEIQGLQGIYGQLRTKLQGLNTAAGALNTPAAFSLVTASSTKAEVATLSAGTATTAGSYNIAVKKLAQAQKISSLPQTDATSALGMSGTVAISGKTLVIEASDSLTAIAQKINSTGAPVTASVLNAGASGAYLTLTSNQTGLSKKLQVSDFSSTVAADLGLVSGAASIRSAITNGASSLSFSSSSTALGSLLGLTSAGSVAFEINGSGPISVDLSTANLQAVADAINASAAGVTATIQSTTENGSTTYKLEIAGAATPTFTDTDGFLEAIGVLTRAPGTELIAAQDAEFTIDTIEFSSASNTVTTAIPGASITLLKANETTPETATLNLTRDSAGIKKKIQDFVDAYNGAVDFIKQNSTFDSENFTSGPLFGDSTAQQVEVSVSDMLFSSVPGLTGNYTNLAALGFKFEQNGKLTVNDAQLTTAIDSAPDAVDALFRARGSTSNSELVFVSDANSSKASGIGAYNVEITQIATKGHYIAELAQTLASTASETLTFNGPLFGNTAYNLALPSGSTLTDTINRINSDSKLKDVVVASNDGGSLKIESKRFGTSGNFTVVSSVTAAADNSGIGVGSLGTKLDGVNVEGTINGEAATGSGQFLTGATDAANVSGLQVQYTGTTLGLVGTLKYTKGVASQLTTIVGGLTDSVNGLLTSVDQTLTSSLDQINIDLEAWQSRLVRKQQELTARFARMEQAISQVQLQSAQLGALRTSA